MNQELPQEPRANPVSDVASGGAVAAELLGALSDRPREPERPRKCALPFWAVPPPAGALYDGRAHWVARYNPKHEVTWESIEGTGSALEKAKTAAMQFSALRPPKSNLVLMAYFLRGGLLRCALAGAWQARICACRLEVNPLNAESFDACSRVDVRPENPKISRKEFPKRKRKRTRFRTVLREQGTGNREI